MAQGIKVDELTPDNLERLALMHPTNEEMALFFGVSRNTLQRYLRKKEYRQALERGQKLRDISLKRAQWVKAVRDGNTTMLIWLGKQLLGQTDKAAVEYTHRADEGVVALDELIAEVEDYEKKIRGALPE